jgi:hypothetical protein
MTELMEKIKALAESQDQLAQQAIQHYLPIVTQFIQDNCTDSNKISYTLDFMLDFCFDEQMLTLYRTLCRHLYSFDPNTAIHYVEAYRERWDEEGEQFGNDKMEDVTI